MPPNEIALETELLLLKTRRTQRAASYHSLLTLPFLPPLPTYSVRPFLPPSFSPSGFKNMPGMAGVQSKWPDVKGMAGFDAVLAIKQSRPELKTVQIVKEGGMVTRDMRFDRVRVYVDDEGNVVGVPKVG